MEWLIDVDPHWFSINFAIMAFLVIFGYIIGRNKRKENYEKRIRELEVDKEYWRIKFNKGIKGEDDGNLSG